MNPIFQKELDVFREEFKKMETFENRFHCDNCRMLVSVTLEPVFLEALKRASMAVVEEAVGEEGPRYCEHCRGYEIERDGTLATAREITGINRPASR